jgi:acyl carrier protein
LCARKGRAEDLAGLDLSQWEVAFVGAERIRAQTLQRFAEVFAPCGFRAEAFFPCYGLAEATLMVSGGPRRTAPTVVFLDPVGLAHRRVWDASRNDPSSRSLVACGETLSGQRIVIADPETCLPCGDDEIGEIWVQGASVARGYYGRPDATAATFDGYLADSHEGPFLRTGDLGSLRDGQLYVTGRLKDLIIIRGRNLYPEDIELSAERAYEGLRPGYCAAFSVDTDDRELLAVVQEVEPRRRDLDTDRALQAIRHAIAARHEVEVHAVALVRAGSIPKTSSGKTRRSNCRERYLNGEMEILAEWKANLADAEEELSDGHLVLHPRSVTAKEVEAWLTRRLATRLRLKPAQVQATTPFIEFGMSSLDAVEIAAELARWLGRPLSPTAIYNYPTVAALARWLARSAADSPSPHTKQSPPRLPDKVDPDRMRQEVQQMTNEEMEAFISKEMASIRQELAD